MTTKRSKNMLNTIVKISQSLIEHHLHENHIQKKILITFKELYIHVHVYVF